MDTATWCLTGLAGLAVEMGRHEAAGRLFGAVETLRETVGAAGSGYDAKRQREDMAAVRDALGTDVDAAARASGRALALEEAVAEAAALADELVNTRDG
jgi:hypothetical protein